MKTMPMVAVVVEAAAAQAKQGHGGYENEFDGILLHNFFRLKCVDILSGAAGFRAFF
jgi:hypothetical protein